MALEPWVPAIAGMAVGAEILEELERSERREPDARRP
jgi:hypothetical protein